MRPVLLEFELFAASHTGNISFWLIKHDSKHRSNTSKIYLVTTESVLYIVVCIAKLHYYYRDGTGAGYMDETFSYIRCAAPVLIFSNKGKHRYNIPNLLCKVCFQSNPLVSEATGSTFVKRGIKYFKRDFCLWSYCTVFIHSRITLQNYGGRNILYTSLQEIF